MKEELRNVTDSSDLGRRMLGFAWEKVQTEISTEKMQRVMDELTMAPITVQSVSVAKATLHTELQDLDAVVGKRIAVICYIGVPITIGVQSVHEEVELRIAAAIKTVAANLLCLDAVDAFRDEERARFVQGCAGSGLQPGIREEADFRQRIDERGVYDVGGRPFGFFRGRGHGGVLGEPVGEGLRRGSDEGEVRQTLGGHCCQSGVRARGPRAVPNVRLVDHRRYEERG